MVRKKITDDDLKNAVKNSNSVMGVLRYLGLREAGGSNSHYKKRIEKLGFDISHFTGKSGNKGKQSPARKKASDILILRESGFIRGHNQLTRAMLECGLKHECSKCGQGTEWIGNKLTLDVDHINENWLDDRIENLRFLCPNCHSQFSRKLIK